MVSSKCFSQENARKFINCDDKPEFIRRMAGRTVSGEEIIRVSKMLHDRYWEWLDEQEADFERRYG